MQITHDVVVELFEYNPETGVFVYRERGRHWFRSEQRRKSWNTMFAGKRAGTVQSKGNGYTRIKIGICGKQYLAHRIAWIYMTGEQPPAEIDHVDRDGTNNSWNNLRDGTGSNQRNKSMQRNNRTGATGVSWSRVCKKWAARIWVVEDGKRIYKSLGVYAEKEDAISAITIARSEHGYDPEHGLRKAPYIANNPA